MAIQDVPQQSPTSPPQNRALWSFGFRPFFLLAGLFGPGLLLFWLAALKGIVPAPLWLVPFWWHGHEMVFGFAGAVIAGFLLTAVSAWTQAPPTSGKRLGLLVALWLAGRIAMALPNALPLALVAVVDLLFFPALALELAPRLIKARRTRNYPFPVILLVFFAANLLTHLDALGVCPGKAITGLRLGVDLVVLLIVILGSRVIPTFTANAFRRSGLPFEVREIPGIDKLSIPLILAFVIADVGFPRSMVTGGIALVTALVLLLRVSGWQTLHTFRDPLLWSLHVGFLWVPLGLASLSMSYLFELLPSAAGLHMLTAGAIGTMTMSMMSRVSLGHTGRPLVAPRSMAVAYSLVTLGALIRSVGPTLFPSAQLWVLQISGLLWATAFIIFAATYAPILTQPRADE